MSLLKELNTAEDIKTEVDSVGSSGPIETDMYVTEIKMAYLIKSTGGAQGIVLHLATDSGREVRQTIYFTSGTAKGCLTYYTKDGDKFPLPGYSLMNNLCLLTVGKELKEMDTQEKTVKVYNFDAKAEVPTQVDVLVDLLEQKIIAGIFKQVEDKKSKGDDGKYHPTGEIRTINEIDKFFRERDKLTAAEILAGSTDAVFYDTWKTKWVGQVRDRSTGAASTPAKASGTFSAGAASSGATKPTKSLFGA